MIRYLNFGIALLLTIIAIAIFTYCAFVGLNFRLSGHLFVTAAITLAALVALVWAMKRMIVSKATRNAREGQRGEIVYGLLATLILALGAVPCSKFIDIYQQQDALNTAVGETIAAISQIDSAYNAYAAERIANVKRAERRSLQRRLMPASYDDVRNVRQEWLATLGEVDVRNPFTATNINSLQEAQQKWTEEYREISEVIFVSEGTEVKPFAHEASAEKLAVFNSTFTEFHLPRGKVVAATLLCICLTLLCYLFTERPKTH